MSTALETAEKKYQDLRRRNLVIDMTRGKPAPDQLDLCNGMLSILTPEDCKGADDYRNYGLLTGTPEAKAFFAEFLDVGTDEIIIGGNASLTLMYDYLAGAVMFGVPGGDSPWGRDATFICPVPGYDRHFAICEQLGVNMMTVDMRDDGPDMDAVEALVANDSSIKGIWCVPKYSNPTGATYSDNVVDRLATMKTAAADFRVMWDNAYAVHHLGGGPVSVKNILPACKAAGNTDRPILIGSTSKISFAGSGVAVIGGSAANIGDITKKMSFSTIGHDKLNQIRHVKFFQDQDGIAAHMDKHAALIAPKFDAVDKALHQNLDGKGLAEWTKPAGGYFVSVDVQDGCAKTVVQLAADAGVKMTAAGATFPYGKDPRDRNLRIAPTMPSVHEIEQAMEIICASIELACARKK